MNISTVKTWTLRERFPATTASQISVFHYDQCHVKSYDELMASILSKYDDHASSFHLKAKPFWQQPSIPEYV